MNKMEYIFQTDFSSFTSEVLKRRFKLVEGDRIQMVIWMGHIHNLSVRDRYFCFTKEGFYWNFPAIVQSGEEGKTAERIICDSDFFQKEGSSFSLVFTKCDGDLNELHIKMGERTFVFQFTKNFPKESIEELERVIRDYFTGYFDEREYEEKAKKSNLRMSLYNIPDFFGQTRFVIADGYLKFLDKIEKFFENLGRKKLDNKTEKSAKTENTNQKQNFESNVQEQYENRFVRFIRHTFDLIADLIFAIAVIILHKPELFSKSTFYKSINIKEVDISFFMRIRDELPEELLFKRNFVILILFAFFLSLKLFVIIKAKKSQKIVCFLLLLILGYSSLLIQYSLLLFIPLALLILLTFQFSMGYSTKSIKIKIWLFFVILVTTYISMSILITDGLANQIKNALMIKANWWF